MVPDLQVRYSPSPLLSRRSPLIGNKDFERSPNSPNDALRLMQAYTMDNAFEELQGNGMFQLFNSLACAMLFFVGSQFFYSIPFYQLYPALTCVTASGLTIEACPVNRACGLEPFKNQTDRVVSYKFESSNPFTLNNWMTELDLICEEPYKIGLMGALSFISFTLGSAFITRIADT